ncbi:MAG: hypothetical protein C4532_06730 [Candidatus Abyssobacteria bacterium SURF_17]|jgi:ABC-type dipeptide/oligopeptide/nickel transport system permease subunit|uniref:Uncharacterized protein n=1 Tax=Candidatus Abyssobacteria bacterium SURF_17 TaxID=2093361 RepID=A0A419F1E1_9BACT|nr:MAG: hypothetical protein C4532_06730 [Candidatus Abyssubacteria bacterium SURF_17]
MSRATAQSERLRFFGLEMNPFLVRWTRLLKDGMRQSPVMEKNPGPLHIDSFAMVVIKDDKREAA